jgi:hypothetical protein
MNEVLLANAALSLVEQLIPVIADKVRKGEVPAADQQELLAKFDSLKAKRDGQFSGPEWQIAPDSTSAGAP